MDRLDPHVLKTRLQNMQSWSKKSLGQHFLVDKQVLEIIVAAAQLKEEDLVVEIGPGLGVLTEQLVGKVKQVICCEFDPAMQRVIREDFPGVILVAGDALQTLPGVLQGLSTYKVVANIPYQITTPLLRLLWERGFTQPDSMVLLVQKEVGKKLAAKPKSSERGYLSVLAQYYSTVEYVADVPRTSFWPEPKVESAVIRCTRRQPYYPLDREKAFLRFVKMACTQQRKQLKNVLAGIRGVGPEVIELQFKELGLPITVRSQELGEVEWRFLFERGTE